MSTILFIVRKLDNRNGISGLAVIFGIYKLQYVLNDYSLYNIQFKKI